MAKRRNTPMDTFREWVSDNLRYILLGLGGVIILLIAILILRLVFGGSSGKSQEGQGTGQTPASADSSDASGNGTGDAQGSSSGEAKAAPGEGLTENDPAILELITGFYEAWESGDVDALRAIEPGLSAEDEADILGNEGIEGFQNITTYSADGLTEGSYVAFVCFDVSIAGIDTPAPTMADFYIETDESGSLVIVDKFATDELTAFMEQMRSAPGVQALIRQVNRELEEASATDDDLKNYVVAMKGGSTEDTPDESATEKAAPAQAAGSGFAQGDEVSASTDINVRSEASAQSVLYGMLSKGQTAEILSVQDDWCKIRYTAGGTTIEGYVMTQYLVKN